MTTDPLLDIEGAAARLSLTPDALRKYVAERKVPHTRIGKHVRFSEDHIAAIIAAGEQPVIGAPARRTEHSPGRPRRGRTASSR